MIVYLGSSRFIYFITQECLQLFLDIFTFKHFIAS